MYKISYKTNVQSKNVEWSSPNYFALALVCWTCSLPNLWKFTNFIYKHGNFDVLLPYLLVNMALAVPLMFAELSLGQYSSAGVLSIWKMCPLWRGTGWASLFSLICLTVNNHYVCTQSLLYMLKSWSLPWTTCGSWGDRKCYNLTTAHIVRHGECFNNTTTCTSNLWENSIVQYYKFVVLKLNVPDTLNNVNWRLIFGSFLILLVVFICLVKPLRILEKVLYFLALIPFLIMNTLLLTSLFYPGTIKGICAFFTPNFKLLSSGSLWLDAINTNVYSIGLGFGGLMTIASRSNFRTNVYAISSFIPMYVLVRDIFFVLFVYSAFAGYSIWETVSMSEIFQSEQSLLFVKIPMVLLKWPYYPNFWSFLFFAYLVLIGFRTTLFTVFTLVNSINDGWVASNRYPKSLVACSCVLVFLLSLVYYTPSGYYIYETIEKVCSKQIIFTLVTIQFIGAFYIYGAGILMKDIHFMLNRQSKPLEYYWRFIPILLLSVLTYNLYEFYFQIKITKSIYMVATQIVILSVPVILWMLGFATHWIRNRKKSFKEIFATHSKWGNKSAELRQNRSLFKTEDVGEEFTYRQKLYTRVVE